MYTTTRIRPHPLAERVYLTVTDASNGTSDPHISQITFSDVDTPPSIDLNGPLEPGTNYSTEYIENSVGVQVCRRFYTLIPDL